MICLKVALRRKSAIIKDRRPECAYLGGGGHKAHGVREVRRQLRDAHVLIVDAPDQECAAVIIL